MLTSEFGKELAKMGYQVYRSELRLVITEKNSYTILASVSSCRLGVMNIYDSVTESNIEATTIRLVKLVSRYSITPIKNRCENKNSEFRVVVFPRTFDYTATYLKVDRRDLAETAVHADNEGTIFTKEFYDEVQKNFKDFLIPYDPYNDHFISVDPVEKFPVYQGADSSDK